MIREEPTTACELCSFSSMKGILDGNEFCIIDQNRGEIEYAPGEMIIKQGSFATQLVFLKSGIVRVLYKEGKGTETFLNLLEGPQFIGLHVLAHPDKYNFSVQAYTECSVCVIRLQTMEELIHKNDSARIFLNKKYHKEIDFLYKRISVLSTRNNHGKLATLLLYLSGDDFKTDLLKVISRKELAQLACISVESSNKILNELKQDKIIEISSGSGGIEILKHDLLQMLSSIG